MSKDNQNGTTLFCYVNGFASIYLDSPVLKGFLSKTLNNSNWRSTGDFYQFPKIIQEMTEGDATDEDSFTMGYSASQFCMSRGGIFINPCLGGLINHTDIWVSALQDAIHIDKIFYIDIPYDVYLSAAMESDIPMEDKEDYESLGEFIKDLVEIVVSGTKIQSGTLH